MLLRIVDRLRAARDAEQGFTIIEVMVAMTVFAIIAAGVAAGITATLYLTQDNRSREAALNLANQALDAARSTKDVFSLDDDTSTSPTINGQTYTVKRTTNWINSDGTDNSCGAGTGVLAYKRVSISVTWTSGSSPRQKSVVLDTLISPSAAVSSATASTIVIGVSGANGPNKGVTVTITPDSGGATSLPNPPAVTDDNGCSYALGVTPGTYKVVISKTGNIGTDLQPTQTAYVTTTTGGVGNKTFLYDQAITATAGGALNVKPGVTAKLPTSLPLTYRYNDTVKTVTTATTTLFPYAWTVIAGAYTSTCKDVDPTAWPTAANLTTSPNVFSDTTTSPATPGFNPITTSTATARAPMGMFDVKMGGSDTVLQATVKNTSAVTNGDPGCSPSTTYAITGLNAATATTVALPYGTWTLRGATSVSGTPSSNAVTVASNPNVSNVNVGVSGNVVTLDPRTVPTS